MSEEMILIDKNSFTELYSMVKELKSSIVKDIDKRWLSTKEVAVYLPYGIDKVKKMIDIQLIEGEHFYRREGKLVFDKHKLDEWVLYTPINNTNKVDTQFIVNDIVSSFIS